MALEKVVVVVIAMAKVVAVVLKWRSSGGRVALTVVWRQQLSFNVFVGGG